MIKGKVDSSVFSFGNKGLFALIDQGLFAGANFIVNILLARWLEPGQYGAFTVAYSVFLLFAAFHTAILTEPMLVYGAGRYEGQFRKYLGILICGHWGITSVIALILAAGSLLYLRFGSLSIARVLAALAFASPLILLLWLTRRAYYVKFRPHKAAIGGAYYLVTTIASLSILYQQRWLTAMTALFCMGFSALLVSAIFISDLEPEWRFAQSNPKPVSVLHDHWRYGKWSSATTCLMWITGSIYYALLPIWGGLEASGALRAVMNIIMPVLHAGSAISVLLVPIFVRSLKTEGKRGFHRFIKLALFLYLAVAAIYCGLIVLFRHQVMTLLYNGRYDLYSDLVIIAAFFPITMSVINVAGGALRALERPDLIFRCYMVPTILTITLGIGLLASKQIIGALFGLLITSFVTAVFMLSFLVKYDKSLEYSAVTKSPL